MILKPNLTENHKRLVKEITREEFKKPPALIKADPARDALREVGILPKREVLLLERTDGDELTPAEAARRAFEDQGLSFAFLANQVTDILANSIDPFVKMKCVEYITKILANNVDGRDTPPPPQPMININILAKTAGGGKKNAFDILVPES